MTALLIVDLQNDFLPGGALPVAKGKRIIPVVNSLLQKPFDFILATKDWHPANHGSFAANHPGKQVGELIDLCGIERRLWPVHCVQRTQGAEFAPGWDTQAIEQVIVKGTDAQIDSYSAFYDNAYRKSTGLTHLLKENRISVVYVAGLATDYCVKYSVIDALKEGFRTVVIENACEGVELSEGDCARALEAMREAGASLIKSDAVIIPA